MDRETALEKAKALARAASLETAGIERVIVPRQTMSRLAHWNERPQFPTPTRWGRLSSKTKSPAFGRAIENIPNVMKRQHLGSA